MDAQEAKKLTEQALADKEVARVKALEDAAEKRRLAQIEADERLARFKTRHIARIWSEIQDSAGKGESRVFIMDYARGRNEDLWKDADMSDFESELKEKGYKFQKETRSVDNTTYESYGDGEYRTISGSRTCYGLLISW